MKKVNRIEICGNIASGKTTLAKAFSKELGYKALFEDFTSIPSLTDFYLNPNKYAFETESMFTLLHYYQLKKISGEFVVADFSLIDDYAFAITTLNKKEFDIYEKLFDHILEEIGLPLRVVMLNTDTNTLLKRIATRRRGNESPITSEYLASVQKNIERVIAGKFPDIQISSIDSAQIDITEYNSCLLKKLVNII